ncbi:serine/threonine protein kinase [Actinomadura sp. KC345]|uniref:protein kinase domain-containing protein n=1 Tax=Actinomadura sp. KC345 TaxID=2530371 RepID=UPI0010512928|nr:peptidylprolyl isomerase [Actinomadura sp. KC345]TDC47162.1 serine/threonine protein kinase [Actinomadura sp. KC345]
MPDPRPLRPNDPREVGGFPLTGRIGEGAQGTVYLGESDTGQRVAVKLLHADFGSDARARTAFERELTAARRVAAFCTAPILAAEADTDMPYIVSEYIDGPSLREVVAERGAVPPAELTGLAIGTATALAAIHAAEVVHRDFKPANVLLGEDGPKVIDFGIARPLDATSATLTGAVGTPAYMAPEQVAGSTGGAPLDMFAWGCTMAFAANGAPPFGSDTVPAIMQRVLHDEPALGALTGELRELVTSCLAKDPASRPTALEILKRLLGTGGDADLLAEGTSAAAHPSPALLQATSPSGQAPPTGAQSGVPDAGVFPPPVPPPAWHPPSTVPAAPRRSGRPLLVAGAAVTVALLGLVSVAAAVWAGSREGSGGVGATGGTPAGSSAPGAETCTYPPNKTGGEVKDVGTPVARPSVLPTGATIDTDLGLLDLELDHEKAPCALNSLAFLAGRKYFDGTTCHRLTSDPTLKVLQCGDPSGTGTGGPGYRFPDENTTGVRYTRGTVAMANAGPDTNGSQFFILYDDAPDLPASYPVIGRVRSGMEVVDKVAEAGTAGGSQDGEPKQKITITELRTS